MSILAIEVAIIRLALVVGVVVSSGCAYALLAGRAQRRRAASRVIRPALEIGSPSSILARASATAAERSSATRPGAGVRVSRPETATGQLHPERDRSVQERESVSKAAAAIALHLAENDPKRMAEVITQWMRIDESGNSPRRH